MFCALLTGCWVIASELAGRALLPGPDQVAQSLVAGLADGTLAMATATSLWRMLAGFTLSFVLAVPVGLALRCKELDDTLGALVLALQALPSICWLPLAAAWFGQNDWAILFMVATGSFLAVTATVRDGVRHLPPNYLRAAQTMGAGPWRQVTGVLLPASLPALVSGAKLGWSFAWRSLMAGELLYVNRGLGQHLAQGRAAGDLSRVMAVMVVIVCIGLLVDRLAFAPLESRVRERWGYGRA